MSTDSLCNQLGPRSGLTQCRSCPGFKPFDTLNDSFPERIFQSLFLKNIVDDKKLAECKELDNEIILLDRLEIMNSQTCSVNIPE